MTELFRTKPLENTKRHPCSSL